MRHDIRLVATDLDGTLLRDDKTISERTRAALRRVEEAGRGVAVANAHPDVLAAVDTVTASNDDDGVAALLERLLPTAIQG